MKNETEVVVQVRQTRGVHDAGGRRGRRAERKALAVENVQPFIEGKTIRKIIVIKGKVVNIVALMREQSQPE
ncbi:MAG: hypothetical protein ACLVJ6_03305 [Merdibacter sp.]